MKEWAQVGLAVSVHLEVWLDSEVRKFVHHDVLVSRVGGISGI